MSQIFSGGLWYRNHCLKITPKKKGGIIRYRYPHEDWQEVAGSDYTIADNRKGQCEGAYYQVTGETNKYHSTRGLRLDSRSIGFPTIQVKRILNPSSPFFFDEYRRNGQNLTDRAYIKYIDLDGNEQELSTYGAANLLWDGTQPTNIQIIRTYKNGRPHPEPDNCGSCRLTILNSDNDIVHEEERDECPEVETIGSECVDDESTKVSIRTSPLGQVWVSITAFSYEGGLLGDLPPECIHVYNMIPYIPIGASPGFGSNGTASQIVVFIGKYCSAEGCERPIVIRLGDDCKESCPDGTCPIGCHNSVCCADRKTGRVIQEIPLSEYSGGELL